MCYALYLSKAQRGSWAADLRRTSSVHEQLQPQLGHQWFFPPFPRPQVRSRLLGAGVRDSVADLPHVHLRELRQLPPLLLPQLLLHPRGRGQLRLRRPGQREGPGLQQGREAPADHLLPGQLPVQVRGKEELCEAKTWGNPFPSRYSLVYY